MEQEKKRRQKLSISEMKGGAIAMDLTDIKKKKYEKFYVNEIDTWEETLKSM